MTADPRGHGAAPATLGVDLGGTGTRAAALSADGEVLREASFPTVAHDPAAAVAGLADALAELAAGRKVSAVGIGASGPVTPDGTIDNAATLPAYAGVDLCRALEQATGWPCVIDNDAAAAALGEYTYGAGRGSSTCLVVTLGTGVGVGVVTGGRLLRGGDGTHAEAGHIAVPDAPRPCYCGLARCWEQAASRIALEELTGAGPATGPGSGVAAVAAAARGGDHQATRAFACYGQQVAPGLSTLLTIFRPDRVVLGGSAAQYLDLFSGPLVAALGRSAPYQWNPPIVAAELGDIAGAVGAAVLARR